jgi:Kef-type K+ transport system membrane component KefB
MITTQVLSLLLRKLRQPRVIAEVLGGILLGEFFVPCHFAWLYTSH